MRVYMLGAFLYFVPALLAHAGFLLFLLALPLISCRIAFILHFLYFLASSCTFFTKVQGCKTSIRANLSMNPVLPVLFGGGPYIVCFIQQLPEKSTGSTASQQKGSNHACQEPCTFACTSCTSCILFKAASKDSDAAIHKKRRQACRRINQRFLKERD